jgi:hypothetical protein
MSRKETAAIIEHIENQFKSYIPFIKKYKEENNSSVAAWRLETIPHELTAAFNIISLKIPSFLEDQGIAGSSYSSTADVFITPAGECSCADFLLPHVPLFNCKMPAGYGEDAAVAIHHETARLLHSMFNIDIKTIDIEKLQEKTGLYEKLRRTVRGICAARTADPRIITNKELAIIFEAALIYPPETACSLIEPLLHIAKEEEPEGGEPPLKAMIFSCDHFPAMTADLIENEGILIAEDDTPGGRRCFDISLDHESEYIFYELLDAYSYKPYAPCIRTSEERYDLLYKLLRNYGIEAVIFLKSREHSLSENLIDYLRIKSMRNGIDVIAGFPDEFPGRGADYIKTIRTRPLKN